MLDPPVGSTLVSETSKNRLILRFVKYSALPSTAESVGVSFTARFAARVRSGSAFVDWTEKVKLVGTPCTRLRVSGAGLTMTQSVDGVARPPLRSEYVTLTSTSLFPVFVNSTFHVRDHVAW